MARARAQAEPFVVPDLIGDFTSAFVRRNVGIVEFAESDEFCNKPLYPRQRLMLKLWFLEELEGWEEDILNKWIKSSRDGGEVTLAPMIRERIEYLREKGYIHFSTIQLVAGRRASKGYLTGIAIAKKVFDLIQKDDPMAHYGVDLDKEIYFPIIAASAKQAMEFQFADTFNTIYGGEFFQKYLSKGQESLLSIYTPADLRKVTEARNPNMTRDLAKIRVAALASSASTIRGMASMGIVMDEMAHMLAGESTRSADQVWDAATPSLKQFDLDGLIFANSSPYTKIGKFHELYEQSLELDGAYPAYPEHFMMQFPSWTLYEDWEADPQRRFRKALMTYDMLKQEQRSDPDKFRVEYMAQFAETVDAFLRPDMVDKMFSGVAPDGRVLNTEHAGTMLYVYKGHGDPSQTTANFGIAIGHIEQGEEDELDPETSEPTGRKILMPHVVFDLIDAFYPADMEDGVIDWVNIVMPTIKGYIRSFRPKEFTFDQFDSEHAIQQLRKEIANMGIQDVRVRPVKATAAMNKRRWDNFKAALYLGRVHAPNPARQLNERSLDLARSELKFLQLKNDKVVKQEIGPIQTKDMADCIAEVVDSLIGDTLSGHRGELSERRMAAGAQEGYGIGKENRGRGAFEEFYSGRARPTGRNPARGF